MTCSQIVLNDIPLISDDFFAVLATADDFEKDIVINDLLGDGQAWGRSKNKEKTLTLNIAIIRLTAANIAKLNRAIAPNGLKTLMVSTPLGVLTTQVEVQSRVTGDSAALVSVTLVMPDPYWYAVSAKSVQLGATYSNGVVFGPGQGVIFGSGQGVVFGTSTGGAATITNAGNADAYPVIHVVGTCSGPSVTNLTTGETVSANVTLSDDDELVIDCRPATCGVYLNGVPNIALKSSPGWMRCTPGDNQIVFSRNSLQNKKHCTVQLNERWI